MRKKRSCRMRRRKMRRKRKRRRVRMTVMMSWMIIWMMMICMTFSCLVGAMGPSSTSNPQCNSNKHKTPTS